MAPRRLGRAGWVAIALLITLVTSVTVYQVFFMGTQGSSTAGMKLGTSFDLIDHNGNPITEKVFEGHPSLVYFGFTRCPEVCPTTLYEMSDWFETLGEEGGNIRGYFITIDPARDTPQLLKAYAETFSDRVTGITGDPDEIARVAGAWHIYWAKVPTDDGDYTMDHTASVFLLAADGSFHGTIRYGEDKETALSKLRELVAAGQ